MYKCNLSPDILSDQCWSNRREAFRRESYSTRLNKLIIHSTDLFPGVVQMKSFTKADAIKLTKRCITESLKDCQCGLRVIKNISSLKCNFIIVY